MVYQLTAEKGKIPGEKRVPYVLIRALYTGRFERRSRRNTETRFTVEIRHGARETSRCAARAERITTTGDSRGAQPTDREREIAKLADSRVHLSRRVARR